VLRYVNAAGAISQTELADGIGVDAANLIETLDELEAGGLIRRRPRRARAARAGLPPRDDTARLRQL
jgi:DNA-binding MarR family transcriptional regulator